jgi:hypothetical protein
MLIGVSLSALGQLRPIAVAAFAFAAVACSADNDSAELRELRETVQALQTVTAPTTIESPTATQPPSTTCGLDRVTASTPPDAANVR